MNFTSESSDNGYLNYFFNIFLIFFYMVHGLILAFFIVFSLSSSFFFNLYIQLSTSYLTLYSQNIVYNSSSSQNPISTENLSNCKISDNLADKNYFQVPKMTSNDNTSNIVSIPDTTNDQVSLLFLFLSDFRFFFFLDFRFNYVFFSFSFRMMIHQI